MGNWKTTASGIAAGLFTILAAQFPRYAILFKTLASVATILLGAAAKDASAKPAPVVAVPVMPVGVDKQQP